MGKATMRSSTNSVSSTLNENSYENHLSMESRMREICTSGLTRGRTSAVIGNASHPVAFSLLYSKNLYTYDRLGRQLSAIADGVSTNLYAYSRYGQLTNEVVQGLCCASAGDNLPRHRRPRPQHRLLAFPSTSGRGPG